MTPSLTPIDTSQSSNTQRNRSSVPKAMERLPDAAIPQANPSQDTAELSGAVARRLAVPIAPISSTGSDSPSEGSRSLDPNLAAETLNQVTDQMLANSALAVMAQANTSARNVLKLLQ